MAPATWSLSVILLLHLYRISPVDAKVDCEICENIVDNIQNVSELINSRPIYCDQIW